MASLAFDLRVFGRRLHLDLTVGNVERQKLIERIGDRDYEVGTKAHRDAQAEAAAEAKNAATAAAEALELERKKIRHLEQELARTESRASVFEAQRDVAVADRQNAVEEVRRMALVMAAHECDAARAN